MKGTPIIFVMFGVIILAVSMLSLASYYGEADWTWMSNQIAGLVVVLMVLTVALYTLMSWVKR